MLVIISNKKGFVLIETIIVMSVLLIGMIILYSNYNKMIINSSKVNYYDNVEDIYAAYYAYKYVNDLTTPAWNSNSIYEVYTIPTDTDNENDEFKKIFKNLNIETIYYFSKGGFEKIFEENTNSCGEKNEDDKDNKDNENQLLCFDGTTINYLRSIENKNDITKCDDSNNAPCITVVKINRDGHYYFAKYEAYNDNKIKINDDTSTEIKPFTFDFTGSNQIFIVPKTGPYKLEVWGAQGGSCTINKKSCLEEGYGAYSVGTVQLHKGDYLFVVVGGQGAVCSNSTKNLVLGGYNGGGMSYNGSSYYVSGGGGATHIAKKSGNLTLFENDLENLLIVAAGGGGGAYKNASGTTGTYNLGKSGGNGTQLNGSDGLLKSFGLGGSCVIEKNAICSGGGGGYYGGDFGKTTVGGSGGESYIDPNLDDGKMYYYEYKTISTNAVSTTCHSGTQTSNCAKEGNGYARITYDSKE